MTQTSKTPGKGERVLGAICWNELHTRDAAGARDFYTKVVGWKAHACPVAPGGPEYTEWVRTDGAHVGGMMAMPSGIPAKVPSDWAAYMNVDDVDATVARAKQFGGRLIVPPFDVPRVGRLAGIADPSGAVFHLIKGVGNTGARVPQTTVGSFCWMELLTNDPAACSRFYGDLLGWTTTTMPMGDTEYTMLWVAGADPAKKKGCVGGMEKIPAGGDAVPSNWLCYIMVDDVDAAVERVKKAGGTIDCEPKDIPSVGRCAIVKDPKGATFALFKGASD